MVGLERVALDTKLLTSICQMQYSRTSQEHWAWPTPDPIRGAHSFSSTPFTINSLILNTLSLERSSKEWTLLLPLKLHQQDPVIGRMTHRR